jgi:hypothetical protein
MSPLELSLAAAALLIGLTGAWSPCGFSMVETIGLAGDEGRRWTTIAACASFAPGAMAGGVLTFGFLSAVGGLTHEAGQLAYVLAALIAVAAAVAEARGRRIAPQIRRQLPEGWRWTMPLPVAAGLYGVLLGLGFTTFVLSFGVWALAGISVALGDPSTGLVIGAAFGVGRAIPIAVVAPVVDTRFGARCIELMAERPAIYRAFRLSDAAALGLVAIALGSAASANAARTEVPNGADPSAFGKALAFQRAERGAALRSAGRTYALPGRDPGLGGPFVAVISAGERIQILSRSTRRPLGSVRAPHARAVAISGNWLAYLSVKGGRYLLRARRVEHPESPGSVRGIASVSSPAQIGHPSVGGASVFYAVSRRSRNSIKRHNLKTGKGRTVLRSRAAQLLNPAVQGKRLLYARVSRRSQSPQATHPRRLRQALMIKRLGRPGAGHKVYSRGRRRDLWTTSLTARRVFVTLLGRGGPKIISKKR